MLSHRFGGNSGVSCVFLAAIPCQKFGAGFQRRNLP
jgi:hypothetical protein